MSENEDISHLRARLGAIKYESKFGEYLVNHYSKLIGVLDNFIKSGLYSFGDKVKDISESIMIEMAGSGGATYNYVDKESGTVIDSYTASARGEVPQVVSGALARAVDYIVHTSDGSLEITIDSDEPGGYPSAYFTKKFVTEDGDEIPNAIVKGETRRTVNDYVAILKKTRLLEGREGPLHTILLEAARLMKPHLQKTMRAELSKKMKQKGKIPIAFRIYPKK